MEVWRLSHCRSRRRTWSHRVACCWTLSEKYQLPLIQKVWRWWWYLKQIRTNLILFLVNYKGISWVWNSAQSKIHCRISKFWIPNENALIDTELWFLADVGFIFEYRAFEVLGRLSFIIFLRSYWNTIIFYPHLMAKSKLNLSAQSRDMFLDHFEILFPYTFIGSLCSISWVWAVLVKRVSWEHTAELFSLTLLLCLIPIKLLA